MSKTETPERTVMETQRLRLRKWHSMDIYNLSGILGDAAVMKFSDGGVFN